MLREVFPEGEVEVVMGRNGLEGKAYALVQGTPEELRKVQLDRAQRDVCPQIRGEDVWIYSSYGDMYTTIKACTVYMDAGNKPCDVVLEDKTVCGGKVCHINKAGHGICTPCWLKLGDLRDEYIVSLT